MTARTQRAGVGLLERVDRYQRAHRWVGLPVAVVYKFADDQGSYLAALITYYGFLSLFPLLLILVTVLGFVLGSHSDLRQQVLASTLGKFPIIGDQLGENIHSLHGSVPALVIGIVVSLYGALRVANAGQNALNQVWAVPRHARPNPVGAYRRSLLLVIGVGVGILGTTALSGLTTAEHAFGGVLGAAFDLAIRVVAALLAVAINTGLIVLAFRVLTAAHVPLRQLRAGAVIAAVAWQVLQEIGTYYVARTLKGASATYGLFGIVLGLLAWIYLGALVVVLCAEFNVVRANRLWPRALLAPFTDTAGLTRADRRAYSSYATAQQHNATQTVEVNFDRTTTEPETDMERTSPHIPRVTDHPNDAS
ncbi:MAG: YihY/virulence factor BrkB family protein [Sciscionella sp.]